MIALVEELERSKDQELFDRMLQPILQQQNHRDPHVIWLAGKIKAKLAKIGCSKAVKLIQSDNGSENQDGCQLMAANPELAVKHIDRLVALSDSNYPSVRLSAMFAIEAMGAKAEPATKMLVSKLKSMVPNERYIAIRTLGKIGEPDGNAVKGLIDRLENGGLTERSLAGISLAKIQDLGDYDLLSKLKASAKKFTVIERSRAYEALGLLGKKAESAVPLIREGLKHNFTRPAAAIALRNVAGEKEELFERLESIEKNEDLFHDLQKAIVAMGEDVKPHLDDVIRMAKRTDNGYQIFVMDTLVTIANDDDRVQKYLAQCKENRSALVRWYAQENLN